MARIVLVSGGARSGKSRYAQSMAESCAPERLYVATCPPASLFAEGDPELAERIHRHQLARQNRNWQTVEETTDLAVVLEGAAAPVVLVDCLTLWVNNLLYEKKLDEDGVAEECRRVITVCQRRPGTVIFVTSEVGCGIVPENAAARLYRDCVGRCNQLFGEAAATVILVACGQTIVMKDE